MASLAKCFEVHGIDTADAKSLTAEVAKRLKKNPLADHRNLEREVMADHLLEIEAEQKSILKQIRAALATKPEETAPEKPVGPDIEIVEKSQAIKKNTDLLLKEGGFLVAIQPKSEKGEANLHKKGYRPYTWDKATGSLVEHGSGVWAKKPTEKESVVKTKQEPETTETKKLTEDTVDPLAGVENDIPKDLATRAFEGTSHSPENRGALRIKDFIDTIKSDYEELSKLADIPEKKAYLDQAFLQYRKGYADKVKAYLSAHGNIVSSFIAGPAKFPVERMRKRSDTADRRGNEATEFRKKAYERMRREIAPADEKGPISADDPEALTKLQNKLKILQQRQERMKVINAAHKDYEKRGDAALEGLSDSDKQLIKNYKPAYSREPHPFAPFQLTNNNAGIKAVQDRIAQLEKVKAAPTVEAEAGGIRVVDNAEDNRIQIFYPEKPDASTIAKLKKDGFKWAPSVGAWQRQRNNNARWAAKEITGIDVSRQEVPAVKFSIEDQNKRGTIGKGGRNEQSDAGRRDSSENLHKRKGGISVLDYVGQKVRLASGNDAATVRIFDNQDQNASDLQRLADVFGKKVVYLKVTGATAPFNGFIDPNDPNTIYINISTPEPHLAIFGHELVHTLKADSPKLYDIFENLMLEQIQNEELFKLQRNLVELESKLPESNAEAAREELIADFVGNRITNKSFMEELNRKEPSLFRKIADIIRSLVDKISKVFKKDTPAFFKDIQKAQDIATDILATYAQLKTPVSIKEAVLDEKTGEFSPDIKFSLQQLKDIKENVGDALPHLVDIGHGVYRSGSRTYQAFVQGMKSALGGLWDTFKHLMLKVFSEAKQTPKPVEPIANAKESVAGDTTASPTEMQANDQRIIENSRKTEMPQHIEASTKKFVEFAGSNIPPKIKAEIGRFLSNPWFGSEGNEHRRSVVLKNVERSHNRNEIRADLYTRDFESNYLGIEGMKNALKELSVKDHEAVDQLIKQGDIDGKEYTADQLLSDQNPTGRPVAKNIINAYKAFRDVIEKAGEIRFARLRELAILSYKNEPWYADLQKVATAKAEDRGVLLAGMPDRQAIEKAFKSATAYWTELERIKKEWHKVKGYAPRTREDGEFFVNAYRKYKEWDFTVRDIEDAAGKTMGQEAIIDFALDADQVNEIKRIAKNHKSAMEVSKSGFITVTKMGGEVSAVLDDIKAEMPVTAANPLLRKVYMQTARSEAGAARHADEVRQALPKHLKSNYKAGAEYVTRTERNTATPEEILNLGGTDMAKEAMITRAFEAAGEKGYLDENQIDALKQGVLESLAREIMARGFARHGIARAAHLIEGYKDRKYIEVATDYASGLAGWLSKMEFAIESSNVMRQIPKEKPDDKVWVHNYVRDAMKNATYADQMAASARSVAALYYLGFKFSAVLLNGFQNFTVAQAELSRHTASPLLKLMAAQRDVMEDYWKVKHGGDHSLSKEEVAVLDKASREGIDQAQAIEFMSGISETGTNKTFHKLTRGGMSMFQWVETHVNREPAMLAAYRVFKKTAAGAFDQAAFDKAEEFVYNTHYLMGKENLPEMARSPLGKTLYVFQGYVHNYLHWMYNRARDGEFSVIARSLAAIAALGGVGALPIAGDVDKWIEKWFGVSYQMKFKKFMREQTRGMGWYGDALNDFVNYGAPSVFGVDMSRALAVNLPIVADPDKSLAERIGGAWGSIFAKPGQAMKAMGAGDTSRAVESLMPEFIANPMRGYRQFTGATTVAGKPIYDSHGRQIRYSGTDVAKKALGFQPIDISKQNQVRSSGIEIKSAWEDKRNNALAQLRRAKTTEDIRAARQNIMQFNSKLRESQAFGLIDIISANTLRRSLAERHDRKREAWSRNYLATTE